MKWPTHTDLLAWYLFMRIDTEKSNSPSCLHSLINEFKLLQPVAVHSRLWEQYVEFRNLFYSPDYEGASKYE